MSVPNSNPPMMAAANEPNMASVSKGIIPKMVVREATSQDVNDFAELSINAAVGSLPGLSATLFHPSTQYHF